MRTSLQQILDGLRATGAALEPRLVNVVLAAAARLSAERRLPVRPHLLSIEPDGTLTLTRPASADHLAVAGYASPESRSPAPPPADDPRGLVHALGALGYELLTARYVPEAPIGPGELKGEVGDVVRTALSPQPLERFSDPEELAVVLETIHPRPAEEDERRLMRELATRYRPREFEPTQRMAVSPGPTTKSSPGAARAAAELRPGEAAPAGLEARLTELEPALKSAVQAVSRLEATARALGEKLEEGAVARERLALEVEHLASELEQTRRRVAVLAQASELGGQPVLEPELVDTVEQAAILARRGRLPEAEAVLLAAAERHPDSAGLQLELGRLYFGWRTEGGNRERIAERHFAKAIELDPSLAAAHALLGHCLLRRGRAEEAARSHHQALLLDPRCVEAHFGLLAASRPTRLPPWVVAAAIALAGLLLGLGVGAVL